MLELLRREVRDTAAQPELRPTKRAGCCLHQAAMSFVVRRDDGARVRAARRIPPTAVLTLSACMSMPRSSMTASRSGPSASVGGATRGTLMLGTRCATSGNTQCACTSMIDTRRPPMVTRFGAGLARAPNALERERRTRRRPAKTPYDYSYCSPPAAKPPPSAPRASIGPESRFLDWRNIARTGAVRAKIRPHARSGGNRNDPQRTSAVFGRSAGALYQRNIHEGNIEIGRVRFVQPRGSSPPRR